ncbi:hypothetical protein FISHEDRAFT_53994 [Fistulina hepatica ATCC 64428]|uniref:Pentacotripeptide-repeat region of PRORP domain-containing protein n=1 Tax=Fistulina hepatica ATCC 64428 TaxID=1128425 RepID=A0A0D7A0A3_9AGAR|nr:hypothetical protein FISHEDRAFT_53994 [Fistulina hepatica ATCC 64428]
MDTLHAPLPSGDQSADPVQVPLLTSIEATALVKTCIEARDITAAETALSLLFPHSHIQQELYIELETLIAHAYADAGNVVATEAAIVRAIAHTASNSTSLTPSPNVPPPLRHQHVRAHLHSYISSRSSISSPLPTPALSVLHAYESAAAPPPLRTYAMIISHLLRSPASVGQSMSSEREPPSPVAIAHAFDLFSHMRYVAHPHPDRSFYSLMIHACAYAGMSEPERALDLWTEMTTTPATGIITEKGCARATEPFITPDRAAYNALILAYARAGTPQWVEEAFRVFREMSGRAREEERAVYKREGPHTTYRSSLRPDHKTYCALLDGAKRIGDLPRTRRILAEMVLDAAARNIVRPFYSDELLITEEVMVHVFHAYASYDPPFRRNDAPLVENQDGHPTDKHEVIEGRPLLAALPPQSSAEVLAEAEILFSRVIATHSLGSLAQSQADPLARAFAGLRPSARLVNSFLSVHYKHGPSINAARKAYHSACSALPFDISPTLRSVVEALERCIKSGRRGTERLDALRFARELWSDWEALSGEPSQLSSKREKVMVPTMVARLTERAHAAYIRTLALCDDVDGALSHIRHFVALYPPTDLRDVACTIPERSTRTALQAQRPLVHLTARPEVADDHVPPLLLFRDLEVVHHRLIARAYTVQPAQRRAAQAGIKYITWVAKSYEGSLRGRRADVLGSQGFARQRKEMQ